MKLLSLSCLLAFLPALAQAPQRSAWVFAADDKGAPLTQLPTTGWKVAVGGKEAKVTKVESPDQFGTQAQSWALVFEPIRDPAFRLGAFQAAAQFLVNLPEGDRVAVVARTKAGLAPITAGLTTDRLAWVKALEALPGTLCAGFEGTPGARGAGLEQLAVREGTPSPAEPFVAALRAFLASVSKAIADSPYGKPEARGVRTLDRLEMDRPTLVRGRLNIVSLEVGSLEALIQRLGESGGAAHCIVYSHNDADDFASPAVRKALGQSFQRQKGDEGGPQESAELAFRETNLAQARLGRTAIASGVTLHSVGGGGAAFLGFFGVPAQATGGLAMPFDGGLTRQLGDRLLAFSNRYRVAWEEGSDASATPQSLAITAPVAGAKLTVKTER